MSNPPPTAENADAPKRKGRPHRWDTKSARAAAHKRWRESSANRELMLRAYADIDSEILEGVVNAYLLMPDSPELRNRVTYKQASVALQSLRLRQEAEAANTEPINPATLGVTEDTNG